MHQASIGVIVPPWFAPELLLDAARAIEAAGVPELWLWEDCFFESGFAPAAAVLSATTTLRVRVGLIPVPLRNVALTAMEAATIARMFPGRFQHVVGHGVQGWMRQVGSRVESPLGLLAEYLEALDLLLAGDEVTMEGRYVSLDKVRLAYPPRDHLRTWGGATGEKTLAMLGRSASGVLVDSGTSPARLREIVTLIDDANAGTGRTRPAIPIYAHMFHGPSGLDRYQRTFGPQPEDPDLAQGLVGDASAIAAGIRRLVRSGATSVVLRPSEDERDLSSFLEVVSSVLALDHDPPTVGS